MRRITFLLAAALGLGIAADALAQGGFSGGSSFSGGGGSSFGGGGSSFGGSSFSGGSGFSGGSSFGGGGFSGGTSFSGGGFSGGSFSGGTSFSGGMGFSGGTGTTGGAMRTGAGGRPIGGSGGVQVSPTNFLAATYANPMYFGRPGATGAFTQGAGGFGQPSYGTVSTTVVQTTTGRGANTGGYGRTGTATAGGFSGMNSAGARSAITYATVVAFPGSDAGAARPALDSRLAADLQAMLARSPAIRQPAAITVEVAGDAVILRGRVTDEDEKRLVEGMVALEPGVHEVRNELQVR
jgi:BON domain-containing protein